MRRTVAALCAMTAIVSCTQAPCHPLSRSCPAPRLSKLAIILSTTERLKPAAQLHLARGPFAEQGGSGEHLLDSLRRRRRREGLNILRDYRTSLMNFDDQNR